MGEGRIRTEPEEGEEGTATLEVISPQRVSVPAGGQGAGDSGSQDERPTHGSGVAVPGDASSLPNGKGMTRKVCEISG